MRARSRNKVQEKLTAAPPYRSCRCRCVHRARTGGDDDDEIDGDRTRSQGSDATSVLLQPPSLTSSSFPFLSSFSLLLFVLPPRLRPSPLRPYPPRLLAHSLKCAVEERAPPREWATSAAARRPVRRPSLPLSLSSLPLLLSLPPSPLSSPFLSRARCRVLRCRCALVRPHADALAGAALQNATSRTCTSRCSETRSAKPCPTCSSTSKVRCARFRRPLAQHAELRALIAYASGRTRMGRAVRVYVRAPLKGRNESAANFTEALNALNTLSYSSNLELQRSAALTFAEITEKGACPPAPAVLAERARTRTGLTLMHEVAACVRARSAQTDPR